MSRLRRNGVSSYVAMTRARQDLHLIQPMRLFRSYQHRHGDGHFLTRRSGFIQEGILVKVERRAHGDAGSYRLAGSYLGCLTSKRSSGQG